MDSQKLAGKRNHATKNGDKQYKKKKLENGSSKPSGGFHKKGKENNQHDSHGKTSNYKPKGEKGEEKSPLKHLRVSLNLIISRCSTISLLLKRRK